MRKQASNKEVLGFDDTWALALGIPLISFALPLLFFKASLEGGLLSYLPEWGLSAVYTVAYWISCRSFFIYFRRRYPDGIHQTRKRLLWTGAAILLSFVVINFTLDSLHFQGFLGHEERPGVTELDYSVGSLMIIALVSTLYESVFFYDRWKRTLVETEQLRRENVESQLEGLKNQVNPHFLFNSLNTLAYIIPEDPGRAVKFVQKLSKVYRYILEIRDRQLVSVQEELHFIDAYLFLLQERFEENLQVQVRVPDACYPLQLVPLSLQILVENAIKHNIISDGHPLHIELAVEGRRMIVRNNLQLKKQTMPSTRTGLQNIKSRYAFLSDEKVNIMETPDYFTVSLPLIEAPRAVTA